MNLNFLQRGSAAMSEMETPTIGNSSGKILRFYLTKGTEALLTFLDGNLVPGAETDTEIIPDVVGAYEHSFMHNGKVEDFLCTMPTEFTCPLCTDRKSRFFNLFFTVIDHRKNVSKQGKVFEYNKRILAVNRESWKRLLEFLALFPNFDAGKGFKDLQVVAKKVAQKSSSIGDFFIYKQYANLKTLQDQGIDTEPIDFSKVLIYRDVETLLKMGFGNGENGPVIPGGTVLNGVTHTPITNSTANVNTLNVENTLVPLDDTISF